MNTAGEHFLVELDLYERNRQEWAASHRDQFAVIRGVSVEGFYETYAAAFLSAVQKFGANSEFLIKQVCAEEPVFVIY